MSSVRVQFRDAAKMLQRPRIGKRLGVLHGLAVHDRADGELAPDDVHLPGIYVHRIVLNATPEKRIEKRTTRDRKV